MATKKRAAHKPAAPAPYIAPPPDPRIAVENQVRKQYGYMTWALSNPELHSLFFNAVANKQSPDEIRANLEKTGWWQQHSDAARQFIQTQSEDPATAQRMVADTGLTLRNMAAQYGVPISTDRLAQMANDAQQMGWNQAEMRQALAAEWHYDPNAGGNANPTVQSLKAQAGQYLVPLDDGTIGKWSQDMMSGAATPDSFKGYLVEQAKSLFPSLTKALDSGITVQQYVAPYKMIAAKDLEVTPESIDFSQPKYAKALNQIDGKTGERVSMSTADWQQEIRSNDIYGYSHTKNAVDQAYDVATNLAKQLGATA